MWCRTGPVWCRGSVSDSPEWLVWLCRLSAPPLPPAPPLPALAVFVSAQIPPRVGLPAGRRHHLHRRAQRDIYPARAYLSKDSYRSLQLSKAATQLGIANRKTPANNPDITVNLIA
jgi:hypothetical protein